MKKYDQTKKKKKKKKREAMSMEIRRLIPETKAGSTRVHSLWEQMTREVRERRLKLGTRDLLCFFVLTRVNKLPSFYGCACMLVSDFVKALPGMMMK